MKLIYLVVMLAMLPMLSCNQKTKSENQPKVETPVENPSDPIPSEPCDDCIIAEGHQASEPIGPEYPIKGAKMVFTTNIKQTNYNEKQILNLNAAEACIAKAMNDKSFSASVDAITSFSYLRGSKSGLTNNEVFEDVFKGAEALMPAVNYQMDLTVTMYYKGLSKVIGWTDPKIMIVHTNSKFHNTFTPADIAGNLFHEWLHKLGYDHESAKDYKSVPYALGYLMRDYCKTLDK